MSILDTGLYVSGGLTVNGDIYYTGSIVDTVARRLQNTEGSKHNILPLENSLSRLLGLRGVSFDWKSSTSQGFKETGILPEDLDNIFPEVTGSRTGGRRSETDHKMLFPHLIEAIRELEKRISMLEGK